MLTSKRLKPRRRTALPEMCTTTVNSLNLVLCSNSFSGLLLAEGLVLFFAFEAHGMMIRSVNPNLQLEQSTSRERPLFSRQER